MRHSADDGAESDVSAEADTENGLIDLMNSVLDDDFLAAVAIALLAFERGEETLIKAAIEQLSVGLQSASELNLVAQWWSHRLAVHLLRDLWQMSFHQCLPEVHPLAPMTTTWPALRKLFVSVLY